MSHSTPAVHTHVVIQPSATRVVSQLREIWEFRELVYFLVWRDVKVRYKQTALGAAWAVIQPFMAMVIFTIFFGKLGNVPSDGLPYPVFTYSALLPWQLFAFGLNEASNSLVNSQNLLKKIYFPRLIIPLASVAVGIIDFGISFVVLLLMMAWYHLAPTVAILAVPLLLVLAVLTAFGVGLLFAAINVKYRDVRYTVPFLTQLWLFATPVIYPLSYVPEKWRLLYALNPMVGVIEGFRWAILGKSSSLTPLLLVSGAVVGLMLIVGFVYFRRMERTFADLV